MVIKLNFCADFEHFGQDFSGEILKLKFGQCFAADVWLSLILVNILKLGLVKISTLDLVEMLMFG